MKFRAHGLSQKEIANKLGLSRQVVGYQLKNLRQRNIDDDDEVFLSKVLSAESEDELLLNELCLWLWEGANILRGTGIEHADFKTYLFPLFFLKRINDVWLEEHEGAMKEIGSSFSENHRFNIPEKAKWEYIRTVSNNVGQALQSSMQEIESDNPVLEGIFGDAQWTNRERFSDEHLKDIIEHFSKKNLGKNVSINDIVGRAYEWAIKKFADLENKAAGEFYTPRPVIRLMIRILKPVEGGSIYDPACGTGGMLLESYRYASEHFEDIRHIFGNLYGQELNLITSAMARANLYLNGIEDFSIARGDTLLKPAFIEKGGLKKFDIVIANPPFSLKKWGYDTWVSDKWGRNSHGMPPKNNGDFAWIQHMIASLKPGGRMAIVLPQGVLFRTGSESKIRKKLLEEDIVECVIGLAPNLFYGTPLAAAILILNKKKNTLKKGKVLLIDASKKFWKGQAQNELQDEDIDNIVGLYENFDDYEDESKVVSIKDIEDNNWNLNIPRYLLPNLDEDHVSLDNAVEERDVQLKLVSEYEGQLKTLLHEANLIGGLDD